MKKIQLFNTAPNGMKVDIVTLTEVPNIDNSGTEFLIEFQMRDYPDDTLQNKRIDTGILRKKYLIGKCDLILGNVYFQNDDNDLAKYNGMTYQSLQLLANWIEKNIQK